MVHVRERPSLLVIPAAVAAIAIELVATPTGVTPPVTPTVTPIAAPNDAHPLPAFAAPTLPAPATRRTTWSMACIPRPFTVLTPYQIAGNPAAGWIVAGDHIVCEGFGGPWAGHANCRELVDGTRADVRRLHPRYSNGWSYPLMNGSLEPTSRASARVETIPREPHDTHPQRASAARPSAWNSCTIWSLVPITDEARIAVVGPTEAWNVDRDRPIALPRPAADATLVRFDLAGERVLAQWRPHGCLDETCMIAGVVDADGRNTSGWVEGGGTTAAFRDWFVLVDGRGVIHTFDRASGARIDSNDPRSLTDGAPLPDDIQLAADRDHRLVIAWRTPGALHVRVAAVARDGAWTLEDDVTIAGADCAD